MAAPPPCSPNPPRPTLPLPQWGLKHYWDALLDADLESDALGWQYVAGCMAGEALRGAGWFGLRWGGAAPYMAAGCGVQSKQVRASAQRAADPPLPSTPC